MQSLPYTVIKSKQQYESYTSILEYLTSLKKKSRDDRDIVELLTVLTEKWATDEAKKLPGTSPPKLLHHLMATNGLSLSDLATELGASRSLVSDILHLRRRISRNIARKLAKLFNVAEELFNKPYKLRV